MSKNEKRPSNEELREKYLNYYQHSYQSKKMRESSLNYFFEKTIQNKREKKDYPAYNYEGHIFDLTTEKLKNYFVWLKNLDTINITTKQNKWHILTSFLESVMEDHEEFRVIIPKKSINWAGTPQKNGKVVSNKNVYAIKEELQAILGFLKKVNFKHYLIFRLLIETGARKGEIVNLKKSELNVKERYINPHIGKTEEKYYFFSDDLGKYLELYLTGRENVKSEDGNLFLTRFFVKYNNRSFNSILENACKRLNIDKNITCQTFRKTLNDFRKEMGCPNEDRKMLIGHKVFDVNVANYTKSDINRNRKLFDAWNPYQNLNI